MKYMLKDKLTAKANFYFRCCKPKLVMFICFDAVLRPMKFLPKTYAY